MSSAAAPDSDWLYLFTSTRRELYVADAIDVMACPSGTRRRFRYESPYVADKAKAMWESNRLIDRAVLVLLSLQHPADFFDAVFVPLRSGKVLRTFVEGDFYIVDFEVGEYLTLAEPQGSVDSRNWAATVKTLAPSVKLFSKTLTQNLGEDHPDKGKSAALGPHPSDLLHRTPGKDATKEFVTAAKYVRALLSDARVFWRIAGIHKGTAGDDVVDLDDGALKLIAGRHYTIDVVHFQPVELTGSASFSISPPPGVNVVGESTYVVRSRYDVAPFQIFTPATDKKIAGELRISTDVPALGPTVRIPTEVRPSNGDIASGPVLGVGGAAALALPAALNTHHPLLAGLLVGGGTLLVGVGLTLRRSRGLPT